MKVVIDIEANSLNNPSKIWVIVCKDIDTGEYHVFREPTQNPTSWDAFKKFALGVRCWIGHNILGYDGVVLNSLMDYSGCLVPSRVYDTLVISKLFNYPQEKHSIEYYGKEFNLEKKDHSDYTKYSPELEDYCIRDVDICERIYLRFKHLLASSHDSIATEQAFQLVCNTLHTKGFYFDKEKAEKLLTKVNSELSTIDLGMKETFVPRLRPVREVIPKETKYGTISLSSIPRILRASIPDISGPFTFCNWVSFNPNSHKQVVSVLNEAGWKPVDKTQTHIDTEREYNRLKYKGLDNKVKEEYLSKLSVLSQTGWKVNENNLETLPPSAPSSARLLAKRILLESRRRSLTEWLGLVDLDSRIHGKFYGIGAWTHRMAHQQPNTANIPNEFKLNGERKLYGKELRALWRSPKNRLLVGVDAEGIQLRVFAHLINDGEFTRSLVQGRKDDKTDPHSLNQRILGSVCKSRDAAKRFIYALLLGAGLPKLSEILECNVHETQQALDRLLERYTGWARLKEEVFPNDAKRGYIIGLDGRKIRIPGDTEGTRRHLAMSGYLQAGEAVIMKLATLRFLPLLPKDCFLVNFVHDEWQTEVPNNMEVALHVASLQADSLRVVGEELKLHCPLAGSYWNDKDKDYTIGTNWSVTH